MHSAHADLLALLVLLAGSFLMPIVSKYIFVPSAVLLIGYGLLVGPNSLNLLADGQVVGFLYELGFIVLMFLAGMEIDFNGMRARGRRAIVSMMIICLIIFSLAFAAAYLLGLHPLFGLALGAISVGLPLAILKETGMLRSQLGQGIIILGSVGEFLTVIGMTLFYFASRYGFSLELLWSLSKLIGMLVLAGITLRAFMAIAWWNPLGFTKLAKQHESSEIGVRAALLLMMTFSTLAILAGLESIVGAFVAGALIAFVLRGKEILEEKLTVVGHGLFIPIFFVIVGMRFDPAAISASGLLAAGQLVLAAIFVRLLPCLLLLRQGLTIREMLGTTSLLAAPLTLVVAIAAIGLELGILDGNGQSVLILLAVASGLIFPIIFRLLVVKSSKA
ncbi:MAG: cation:proton antiporter [Deltaproteobacteria bacterium]|nr:cation:proton antiporter [Deltaproteobacteria bacterium]